MGTTPDTGYSLQARSGIRKEAKVRNLTMLSISYCPLFRELHMRTYLCSCISNNPWVVPGAPSHAVLEF